MVIIVCETMNYEVNEDYAEIQRRIWYSLDKGNPLIAISTENERRLIRIDRIREVVETTY